MTQQLKKITLFAIPSILIILFILRITSNLTPVTPINNQIPTTVPDTSNAVPAGQIIKFEGVLTDYDSGCAADAECIAYVDGYEIIVNPGFVIDGPVIGTSNVNSDDINKDVRVQAMVVEGKKLTIVGSEELYVLLK